MSVFFFSYEIFLSSTTTTTTTSSSPFRPSSASTIDLSSIISYLSPATFLMRDVPTPLTTPSFHWGPFWTHSKQHLYLSLTLHNNSFPRYLYQPLTATPSLEGHLSAHPPISTFSTPTTPSLLPLLLLSLLQQQTTTTVSSTATAVSTATIQRILTEPFLPFPFFQRAKAERH